MAIYIQRWDEKKAEQELKKRRKRAVDYRSRFEAGWLENELTLFTRFGEREDGDFYSTALENMRALRDERQAGSYLDINYAFRHYRFIHAQMSNNPPSVIPKPTSSDYGDRQAALAADKFIQHARRKLRMQERVDLASLLTLSSGTGWHRIYWDTTKGEALDVDEETGEILMTGDITSEPVSYWDVYIDPDAVVWDDVKWLFHRHRMPYEEALARWPDKKDKLEHIKRTTPTSTTRLDAFNAVGEDETDSIEVWEYWEKGLPWNGLVGRHAFTLEDGCILAEVEENPFPEAMLPYDILTDIDVPGQVYGKTFVDYIAHVQDILNRMDSQVLDGVKAHAVARLVVVNGEVTEEGLTNENWDVLPIKTGGDVHYVNPPSLMPDLYRLRESIIVGMEAIAGVNESMYGQVKREMSGFSLQTAIDAGNMVRSRLFNKYKMFVENIYTKYLMLVQAHYSDRRKIVTVGEEDALSVSYLSGADIDGGYDLCVEFGTSFSLNPAGRREEILQMWDKLVQAGISPKTLLSMMRLNEIETTMDIATLGKKRQDEIFEEMISKYMTEKTAIYIAPEKNEDHASMLEECRLFRMSAKWRTLPPELQQLLDKHIDDRMQMQAQQIAPSPAPAGAPGAPTGLPPPAGAAPGALPLPPGAVV